MILHISGVNHINVCVNTHAYNVKYVVQCFIPFMYAPFSLMNCLLVLSHMCMLRQCYVNTCVSSIYLALDLELVRHHILVIVHPALK